MSMCQHNIHTLSVVSFVGLLFFIVAYFLFFSFFFLLFRSSNICGNVYRMTSIEGKSAAFLLISVRIWLFPICNYVHCTLWMDCSYLLSPKKLIIHILRIYKWKFSMDVCIGYYHSVCMILPLLLIPFRYGSYQYKSQSLTPLRPPSLYLSLILHLFGYWTFSK